MAHNQQTFALSGKNGKIVINGQDLHLTKFGLQCKTDKAQVTNTRSPLMKINGVSMLVREYLPTSFDGVLTFEGTFTIKETASPTYTGLMFSSGTILPSFGGQGDGLAAVVLTPDNVNFGTTEIVQGNAVIDSFELSGEVETEVTFKGQATFSGGFVNPQGSTTDFTTTTDRL